MERRRQFTEIEKRELMKIVRKFGEIINNKCTDSNSVRKKTIAWNRIACEYNTSSVSPYPSTSKQLRRLWMNLKHRNKVRMEKLRQNSRPASATDHLTENNVKHIEEDEEISPPFFVSVEGNDTQDSLPKTQISVEKNQNKTIAIDSEGRPFNVEFIDEMVEDMNARQSVETDPDKDLTHVKKNFLAREYEDRKRRQNELHLLQKRLLVEQIREARAKADLAELELRQQTFLD